jgi:hypothetical protein
VRKDSIPDMICILIPEKERIKRIEPQLFCMSKLSISLNKINLTKIIVVLCEELCCVQFLLRLSLDKNNIKFVKNWSKNKIWS